MSTTSVRPSPTTSMAWMPRRTAPRFGGRAGRMSLTCLPASSPPRGASQTSFCRIANSPRCCTWARWA